jgi:hypothetical protein
VEAVDEFDAGFGWLVEDEFMERCSHALVAEGHTWLVDPVEAPHVRELADVAGVIQLLDRHNRDCASLASRFGVPHHVVPQERLGPFEFLPVRLKRRWREVALWWPERRVLACGDALGTARYGASAPAHPPAAFRRRSGGDSVWPRPRRLRRCDRSPARSAQDVKTAVPEPGRERRSSLAALNQRAMT